MSVSEEAAQPNPTDTEAESPKRRSLLKGFGVAALVAVAGYLTWNRVLFPPGSPQPLDKLFGLGDYKSVEVATLGELSSDKNPKMVMVGGHSAFAEMIDGKPVVLSAICPHAGCDVFWHPDKQQFVCPCHHSVFARDGSVVDGPARVGLYRLATSVQGEAVYAHEA